MTWAPSTVAVELSNAVYVLQQAEDLKRARRTAEAASLAKGEFLARMSHEIRTPLTAVMGYLDLCMSKASAPDEQRYLARARASSKVLLGVLNDILDFSKIEAQRLEVERTRFDLGEVLDQIVATCGPAALAKSIELVLDVADEVPKVLVGDPLRLTQVLVNLMGNAIKFTAQGEVVLSIENGTTTDEGHGLRFSVRDTGVGIAPESLSKLMAPFVQADNSTTRRYGGTGLGLAISQRLVHRMGGSLSLESEPGQGTECCFSLRFADASEQRFSDDFGQWPDLRVLVVDNNTTALTAMTQILARAGCKVMTAADGEATIERMERGREEHDPVDLILLDEGLPGLTGSDVVRRLVERGLIGDCRILLLAPLGELEPSSTLFPPNVLGAVISKPVRRNALQAQFRSLLRPHEVAEPTDPCGSTRPSAHTALAGKRVLVVQDDETNCMLAKELLESAGLEVHIAENGLQAVERAAEGRYQAILMDLHLPLMDGWEAARIIRQQQDRDQLPILAVTASSAPDDRQRCFDVGMNDYVQTPIDAAELIAVLAQWLRPRRPDRPAGRAISQAPPRSIPVPAEPSSGHPVPAPQIGSDWLDVQVALQRLRGDAVLYRRLLRRFLESHRCTAKNLRASAQPEVRLRLVHTLGSSAANVGAMVLHRTALALERELRAGRSGTEEAWGNLESVLGQTLEILNTASGNSTTPPGPLADRGRLREELAKLAHLLDRCDVTASEMVDELPAVAGSGSVNEEVRRIQRAARAFEFEEAAQRVQALLMILSQEGP